MSIQIENLEEAAWLVTSGYALESARVNSRGYVTFEFPDEAAALLAEFHYKDVVIPSLRQFSKAHKNLRTIVSKLRSEARGKNHVESHHN